LSGTPRYQNADAPAGFFPPDRDAPRPLAASGEGWAPVRAGLAVLQVGLGLIGAGVAALALLLLGLCLAGTGGMRLDAGLPTPGEIAAVGGALITAGIILLGGLVFLVGQGICCAVPVRSGHRGLILTALVCSLAGQALGVASGIADASGHVEGDSPPVQQQGRGEPLGRGRVPSAAGALLSVSAVVFLVVGHFLLAGFLRGVGRYFGDLGLAGQAHDYIKHLGTFLAIVVGLLVISYLPLLGFLPMLTCLPWLGYIAGVIALSLVLLIYGAILFIKLFNLLASARATVATAMAQG
jgi:hypothetical protein